MKSVLPCFLLAGIAFAQLPQATGDDFTIAVYNDIHTDNDPPSWVTAVDWLVGANGRGPGGFSAVRYWNIKAIAGVGDYVTTCNVANWTAFMNEWSRISALALPGVWPQGNHDNCASYTTQFTSSLQSATLDVSTTRGTVRLGLVGVGVADDMQSGQASRTYVDGAIAASDGNRQWIFLRHVGTYESYPGKTAYVYPAYADLGWCADYTQCAGFTGLNTGTALRDNFYQHESRVFWGVHGHNGFTGLASLTADDGHTVNVIGHLGASGGRPGWITLLKFRPSHNDIQVAVYLSNNGAAGSIDSGPFTWPWTPEPVRALSPAVPRRGRVR